MNLRDNMIAAVHFECMQRCIVPMDDGFADPTVNFDLMCKQVGGKIEKEVQRLTELEQKEYFLTKSLEAMEWCQHHNAPADLSISVMQWRSNLTS